jgi:hypothetical protein
MLDFIVFNKLLMLESGKDQGKNICLFQRMPPAGVFVLTGFRIFFARKSLMRRGCSWMIQNEQGDNNRQADGPSFGTSDNRWFQRSGLVE